MFDWITKHFRKKIVDSRAFLGVDWPGSHIDAFKRVAKPSKEKLVEEYKGFAYICANFNAEIVASKHLKLYRILNNKEKCRWKTKRLTQKQFKYLEKAARINLATGQRVEEVTNHPALNLLKDPNPWMTGQNFKHFHQLYLEMAGVSAWRIIYGTFAGERIPLQIYMLQPQWLKIEEDEETGFPKYYQYGGKHPIRLELDEVICFKLPNLRHPYLDGHAPLLGVYEDVNILDLYKATEAAILNNEGRPDVLVSAKDGMGDPERFEKKFNTKFRRGGKSGILIAEDDVTVTPLSWSPKDLAFVKVGEQAKEMISLAFGITPALLEGASQYDVDNCLANRHVINAVIPRLERNVDVLNHRLLPLFDDSGLLFFGFEDPSVVNKEQQLEEDCRLVQTNVITPNEVRISRGYEPTTWGEVPAGMYNATGTTTADETDPDTANDSSNEAAGAGEIQESGLNGAQIEGLLQIVEAITNGQLTPEAGKILIGEAFPLFDSSKVDTLVAEMKKAKPVAAPAMPQEGPAMPPVAPMGKSKANHTGCCCKAHKGHKAPKGQGELVEVLKAFFSKQRKEILASLKSKSKAKGLPSKFVPLKSWNRELYDKAQPLIQLAAQDAYGVEAQGLVGRAGISPDVFNVKNPHLSKKIDSLALSFCEETNNSTSDELNKALDDLRESFEEGMGEGERFNQLVERVGDVFDRATDERAELIAHTESTRAYGQGQKQSAIDSGVVSGFKLMPASECCELCQSIADSGEIDLDGSFHTDKDAPEAYQVKDTVPIHPRCFCTMESVLAEKDMNDNGLEEDTDNGG